MLPAAVYLLVFLAFGTLIAHAAINVDQLGGSGMALHLTPYPIYPKEMSYRNLVEKGNFAEVVAGAEIKQQIQYESGARLWNSVRDFTFEAWVKPGPNEGRTCCWPLLETYSTTDASAPAFIVKIGDGGILIFTTRGGLTPANTCYTEERSVVTDWSAFDGKWHHIAVTFDSTNGRKILYGDGQVLKNWTCTPGEIVKAEGGSFNIGWTKRSTPPGPYDGYLEEVRAWNVTRTQPEIQAAMSHTIRDPTDIAKMIFYYPMDSFDPLQPFMLKDMSPLGFDIKMSNIERTAPKFVPSGAPISGGQVSYHSLTRASEAHNGQLELPLVNSTISTGLTITITSFPNCTAPNAILSTANGVITSGGVTTFPAANKLIITAGAASVGTSSEEMCSFKYTVFDGVTTTTAYTVNLLLTVNRAPIPGDAGGALYCDGDDFAYNKDFTFNRPLYGEYTIEFWSYHFYSDGAVATLFSVGNNEIGVPYSGNWCLGQTGRWNQSDYCIGRFKFDQYTASGRAEMYNSWNPNNDDGFLSLDISPYFEQWKHTAIVSKSDKLQMYLNGKLLGETTNHQFYGARDGFYLCHWPFWGEYHWYKGFIDEFRVFNYTKSQQQIQSTMHRTLTGGEDGLIAYWNFDEVRDTTAMGAVHDPKTKIVDKSVNKFHLTPGRCVPNVRPQCPLGDKLCLKTEVPQTPCYDGDGTTQNANQRPALYVSNAPVGGYSQPLLAGAGQNATFILDAFDPDGDALSITILAIPDRGAFYKSNGSKVAVGDSFVKGTELRFWNEDKLAGGYPATKFSYRVSDGKDAGAFTAAVDIYVKCPNATFLDSTQNRCVSCPYGSYMMTTGFETKCHKFSNFLWSSPLGVIIALLTSAGLAAGAGTAVFVLVYRKSKVVRAASPVFCLMIVAGVILALIAVFFYLDIPTPAACVLQPLLVSVAFTLSIGNLVIKTMRVNIVFNYPLLARRLKWVLKDGFLIGVSVCAVLFDLIILITWFVVDRPRPTMLRDVNEELYWGCNSSTPGFSNKASGALIAYNGLMLLAGIYSAYKVRNVKSAFNESQHIVPSIYIITLVSIILLPMNYAVELFTYKVRSLFVAFLLIVCSVFVLLQMFVPKIMAVRYKGSAGEDTMTGMANTMDAGKILRTAPASPTSGNQNHPPMPGERRVDSVGTTSNQEEEMQTLQSSHMSITLVEVQIGGGFLSGFSAYSAILPTGSNAIILRKYRQNVAFYFSYNASTVAKVGEEIVGFTSVDGQKIKLKFEKTASRDQWYGALRGGAKSSQQLLQKK
ncbi:7 transmembrane sweet-taste receptor of 3 GCPR-domain-containing protein [Phlyctochytrium arcticum]|nr:7 transmembrane sweet-taste receptor of 3 GCPR-domain-containing protein [Phlyctochytrium arcticum]